MIGKWGKMEISVNGKTEQISEGSSIEEFIQLKNLNSDRVVVELNKNILKKDEWQKTILGNGDELEIIQIVGGG